jgi:hypothetical protein
LIQRHQVRSDVLGEVLDIPRNVALRVETAGGVGDLGRVVGVLALLSLTPASLMAQGRGEGFSIDIRLVADARRSELCLARLRALVAVTRARLSVVATAPSKGRFDAHAQ